jgi:hypothetical protein
LGLYAERLIGKIVAYLVAFEAAAAIVSFWFEGRGRAALRVDHMLALRLSVE